MYKYNTNKHNKQYSYNCLAPPPPQKKNWLRCLKLKVTYQQSVVNSRL